MSLGVLVLAAFAAGCGGEDEGADKGAGAEADTFAVTMPAESMEPTIKAGSRVLVTRVSEDYEPQSGQIVLFEDPGGWLTPLSADGDDAAEDPGKLLKRVVGVPGDTVTCCDGSGRLAVNGVPLDEPYLSEQERCAGAGVSTECDWSAGPVPSGTVFVLGDNRGASVDSRLFLCGVGLSTCSGSPWVDLELVEGTVDGEQDPGVET